VAGGELIISSGYGNGYRFAEVVGASNLSGWSGCIVKNPPGARRARSPLFCFPCPADQRLLIFDLPPAAAIPPLRSLSASLQIRANV
jgi:hypothetical protein